MTRQEAIKVNKLLSEIESIEFLSERLEDVLADFEDLPQGLYSAIFQLVEQYLNDKKDELEAM